MALPRIDVVSGITTELESFSVLLRSLSPTELARPSRCAGWTAGDVAGHVVGQLADVVALRLDGLGTPEATERQAAERRGRTGDELADELDGAAKQAADLLAAFDDDAWNGPAPGGVNGTLGFGVEALWFDGVVHADDILHAVGRPSPPSGPGLRAAVSHVAGVLGDQGYGPAVIALDGVEEFPVGTPGAGAARITGDPFRFVLAATGRIPAGNVGLDPAVNIYR
jgi:uncharacterized protein (TIGR03083 family)